MDLQSFVNGLSKLEEIHMKDNDSFSRYCVKNSGLFLVTHDKKIYGKVNYFNRFQDHEFWTFSYTITGKSYTKTFSYNSTKDLYIGNKKVKLKFLDATKNSPIDIQCVYLDIFGKTCDIGDIIYFYDSDDYICYFAEIVNVLEKNVIEVINLTSKPGDRALSDLFTITMDGESNVINLKKFNFKSDITELFLSNESS